MSADKPHDLASQQLQLFECDVPVEIPAAPSNLEGGAPGARAVLHLISNTTLPQSPKVVFPAERLSAIEARLVDRVRYF